MNTRQRTDHESRYQYVYRNGYLVQQRRKLGPHDHRGVDYYDRERMKKPLAHIVHPGDAKYQSPPSWVALPESWGPWEPVVSNHFHNGPHCAEGTDAVATAETAQYVFDDSGTERMPFRLRFNDGAEFLFASRPIAEAALSELLKIRKAKHPTPKYGGPSSENSDVFFTCARWRKLSK